MGVSSGIQNPGDRFSYRPPLSSVIPFMSEDEKRYKYIQQKRLKGGVLAFLRRIESGLVGFCRSFREVGM